MILQDGEVYPLRALIDDRIANRFLDEYFAD